MISHPHQATTGIERLFWSILGIVLVSILLEPGSAHAFTPSDTLYINQVRVRGIEEVLQLDRIHRKGHKLDYLVRIVGSDGLDQVLVITPDSTLWLAYGRHILLYADSIDNITSVTVNGEPADIPYLNDENDEVDTRKPLGKGLAAALIIIVLAGFTVGLISGTIARRSFAPLGRNPIFDHTFYGLVVGILAALLIYGLSDRRFDVEGLFAKYTTEHMHQFMLHPPEK